jgi:hypothetical protein
MGQARALAEVRSESALSSELQRLLLDVGVAESSIARATHNISSTLGTLKRVEQRLHELDIRGRVAALTGGQHGQ